MRAWVVRTMDELVGELKSTAICRSALTVDAIDWWSKIFSCFWNVLHLNSCDGNDATPATWCIGRRITKRHRRSSWSMQKAVTCKREGERTSLWTSAKLKPAFFRATNSLPRKSPYVLRHSVAVIVTKNKETRKVEYTYYFFKVCWCCFPEFARFLRQCSLAH